MDSDLDLWGSSVCSKPVETCFQLHLDIPGASTGLYILLFWVFCRVASGRSRSVQNLKMTVQVSCLRTRSRQPSPDVEPSKMSIPIKASNARQRELCVCVCVFDFKERLRMTMNMVGVEAHCHLSLLLLRLSEPNSKLQEGLQESAAC